MILSVAQKPATMSGWLTDAVNTVKRLALPGEGGGSPTVNVAAPSTAWIMPVAAIAGGVALIAILRKPSRR